MCCKWGQLAAARAPGLSHRMLCKQSFTATQSLHSTHTLALATFRLQRLSRPHVTLWPTQPETPSPRPCAEKAWRNPSPSAPCQPRSLLTARTACSCSPCTCTPGAPTTPAITVLHAPLLPRMGPGVPESITLLALPPRPGCWAFTPSVPSVPAIKMKIRKPCTVTQSCQRADGIKDYHMQNMYLKQLRYTHTHNCPLSTLWLFLFFQHLKNILTDFPGGSDGKSVCCNVGGLGSIPGEDLLEKEMVTHSSILAWKIPWMEEPGRLQSVGSQRDTTE